VGITAHFIHICSIQRAGITIATDVPCRLVAKAQRILDSVTGQAPIVTSYLMLFGRNTDVKPSDKIIQVTGQDGSIDPNVYEIRARLVRNARAIHHISVQLERVSSKRP
jgi:hypothetical protein